VGGVLLDEESNAHAGKGEVFVIEADEYDRMFMGLRPRIIVLTKLEMDHPDMFKDMHDVRVLFRDFVDLLPEDVLLIAGHDNRETLRIVKSRLMQARPALSYGLTGGTWLAADLEPNNKGGLSFSARHLGFEMARVALRVPGEHNVHNALAVMAVAHELGIEGRRAADALGSFSGVKRRFEIKGEVAGVTIVDDYAHHPTAIRATLEAARQRYGPARQIWAVWQPHTFQRTQVLLNEFATSFGKADHVIITDVYRSRDRETFGVGPESVIAKMPGHPDVRHIATLDDAAAYLAEHTQPGHIVIILSAGDATHIGDRLLLTLKKK